MDARYLELEILASQVGVEEAALNNTGARVEEYQTADNIPGGGYAWCVAFGWDWGRRLATGGKRVKKAGKWIIEGGKALAGATASCSEVIRWVKKYHPKWVISGHGQKADKMIFADGSHFMTIKKYQKLVAGYLYVVTIEGNTTSAGALSTTPHNRDGVYRKRRIVKRSSVVIIRTEGKIKAVDPLAKACLSRIDPKAPKAAIPTATLKAKKGKWSWIHWTEGDGMWSGYQKKSPIARPNVPARIPKRWWPLRALYIARKAANR